MLDYTRRQLVLLFIASAVATGGFAIDRWRRANPEVVEYLETLDRNAPAAGARESVVRNAAPTASRAHTSGAASPTDRVASPTYRVAAERGASREPARTRRRHGDDATPIDVNVASAAEFERLPGVGPALAARIVEARARDGPFRSVDDLRRVRGVGEATLARLRPRLAVNMP